MINTQRFIARCELTIFFAMCAMIWFIPISPAIVEWTFGIGLVAYLIKRVLNFSQNLLLRQTANKPRLCADLLIAIFKPFDHPVSRPLSIFVLIALLSSAFGVSPSNSFPAIVFKMLQNIFTAVFFVEAVNSQKRIKIFFMVYLASFFLININGIYQYFLGADFIRHRSILDGRVISSFHHPNDFASYLIVAIPILFSFSIGHDMGRMQNFVLGGKIKDLSGFFQFLSFERICFVLMIISILTLGQTFSRGGWVACAISLFFLTRKRPKLLMLYLVSVALFLGIFTNKMVKERKININGSFSNVIFNTSDRFNNWKESLTIISERPIFGVGLNNYTKVAVQKKFRRQEYPHNCYLHMAAEVGIAGLFSFLWFLWVLFAESLKQLKKIRDPLNYRLILGSLVGLTSFLIQSFLDTNFYSTQLSSLMWLAVGWIIAIPKIEFKGERG